MKLELLENEYNDLKIHESQGSLSEIGKKKLAELEYVLLKFKNLSIGCVMPLFIGIATELSKEGRMSLDIDDRTMIEAFLPCNVYETEIIAQVDGSKLLWLEGSPQKKEFYVHKMFLSINEA